MKTISTKQMLALKKSGSNVKILKVEPEVKRVKGPSIEQSLVSLNNTLKVLVNKNEVTDKVMKSVEGTARILSTTIDKIKELKPVESAKIWNIEVQRDDNLLITSLKMKNN